VWHEANINEDLIDINGDSSSSNSGDEENNQDKNASQINKSQSSISVVLKTQPREQMLFSTALE